MIKKYCDPRGLAKDARVSTPHDERVAMWAARIIQGTDDYVYHVEKAGIPAPKPNKSARLQRRGDWVFVEASGDFFSQVDAFVSRAEAWLNKR